MADIGKPLRRRVVVPLTEPVEAPEPRRTTTVPIRTPSTTPARQPEKVD